MIKAPALGALLLILFSTSLFAQGLNIGNVPEYSPGERGCVGLEKMGLSETQREALLMIDKRYKELLLTKRKDLMIKRIELQELLRDPNAEESAMRQKSLEIGSLREAIREKMIAYQIEIRRILTPDQMRNWCTLVGVGLLRQEW